MGSTIRLAVIGGDGIGPEVTAEALKVLRAATPDVTFDTTDYDLGARRWHRTGETLPDAVLEEIRAHDAILLGAVGDPSVPSGVLERGLLLRLRFELDHYVNLRPVRLYPGVASPLAKGTPETIDMVVVREGTEGPYTGAGGVMRRGTPQELATQESYNTAFGVERVARYAFGAGEGAAAQEAHAGAQDQRAHLRGRPLAAHGGLAGQGVPRGLGRVPARGRGLDVLRQPAGAVRRHRDRQPVRRHPHRPGRGHRRRHRPGGQRQHQPHAGPTRRCSSRCTAARPTSPGSPRPTRPRRSCRRRCCCSHLGLPAAAAKIEQAVADDVIERQGQWQARTTVEIGDDVADRVSG